ncbi:FAD-dependent oxidoreductase [Rhodotorula paludigena]|uniref:FAD-dependent oxidoreductase n=1 Tax=Rhodotorula paludigena TaxID=86838 RepID=UPI00316D1839
MPHLIQKPQEQHVLIVGAGLVGLVVAQGLKRRGVKTTVFERQPDAQGRTTGWAVTYHWALHALEKMLPSDLYAELPKTAVDPFLGDDEGNFLVLDARDCSIIHRIPPSKARLRTNRTKFRQLLLSGLDVHYEKDFGRYELVGEHGVRVHFTDGTSVDGTTLVGCDGNNSKVRRQLFEPNVENATLNSIPVISYGVVRQLTAEQIAPLRALDPLLFMSMNPDTETFIWYSIQSSNTDQSLFEVLVMVSHLVQDRSKELPKDCDSRLKIQDMKSRMAGIAEPLFSLINDIPEDSKATTISLADWVPHEYDSHNGRVVVAGDATGPMTMYRGEGVNHGTLDAALLVQALSHHDRGLTPSLGAALDAYQTEVRERRKVAIPLSRQAALDGHGPGKPSADSPLVGARGAPASLFTLE